MYGAGATPAPFGLGGNRAAEILYTYPLPGVRFVALFEYVLRQFQIADKAVMDRHRRFLVGKKAARDIMAGSSAIIVKAGDPITEEVLQKAQLAGKLIELSMNAQ